MHAVMCIFDFMNFMLFTIKFINFKPVIKSPNFTTMANTEEINDRSWSVGTSLSQYAVRIVCRKRA